MCEDESRGEAPATKESKNPHRYSGQEWGWATDESTWYWEEFAPSSSQVRVSVLWELLALRKFSKQISQSPVSGPSPILRQNYQGQNLNWTAQGQKRNPDKIGEGNKVSRFHRNNRRESSRAIKFRLPCKSSRKVISYKKWGTFVWIEGKIPHKYITRKNFKRRKLPYRQ